LSNYVPNFKIRKEGSKEGRTSEGRRKEGSKGEGRKEGGMEGS